MIRARVWDTAAVLSPTQFWKVLLDRNAVYRYATGLDETAPNWDGVPDDARKLCEMAAEEIPQQRGLEKQIREVVYRALEAVRAYREECRESLQKQFDEEKKDDDPVETEKLRFALAMTIAEQKRLFAFPQLLERFITFSPTDVQGKHPLFVYPTPPEDMEEVDLDPFERAALEIMGAITPLLFPTYHSSNSDPRRTPSHLVRMALQHGLDCDGMMDFLWRLLIRTGLGRSIQLGMACIQEQGLEEGLCDPDMMCQLDNVEENLIALGRKPIEIMLDYALIRHSSMLSGMVGVGPEDSDEEIGEKLGAALNGEVLDLLRMDHITKQTVEEFMQVRDIRLKIASATSAASATGATKASSASASSAAKASSASASSAAKPTRIVSKASRAPSSSDESGDESGDDNVEASGDAEAPLSTTAQALLEMLGLKDVPDWEEQYDACRLIPLAYMCDQLLIDSICGGIQELNQVAMKSYPPEAVNRRLRIHRDLTPWESAVLQEQYEFVTSIYPRRPMQKAEGLADEDCFISGE